MTETLVAGYGLSFSTAIDVFLQERLQAKLDKLKPDEEAQRADLIAQFQRNIWLDNAAKRVQQIQAVTHSLKPIHPDARGTTLYVQPSSMVPLAEMGSHALGDSFAPDVVGNAAALDVYKFLKVQAAGISLLAALQANVPDALQALSADPQKAQLWRDAFVSLVAIRGGKPASHGRAKQLYWLVGDDPTDDAAYQLLAPLYATSLAHAIYGELQEHRFGDANKAARQARREGKAHDGVHHVYRDLAVQKMGGTKPQNVSQLNSERGGTNYLLASLPPPAWAPSQRYLPMGCGSAFDRAFGARPAVRRIVKTLLVFLQTEPDPNRFTREKVDGLISSLVDEVVIYAGELLSQPAGWSLDDRYDDLADEEKLWLDPMRAELPDEADFAAQWLQMDWPAHIAKRFSLWLNAELQGKLSVGDAETRQWQKMLLSESGSWAQSLRTLCDKMDAPNYIAFRKTHDEIMARGGAA